MLTFRLAKQEDMAVIQDLWAYCFEPKENPFFQWYFTHYCKTDNVLLGLKDGALWCNTHLNQYTVRLRNASFSVSYIVGLATHPAARSKGVGAQLLTAALEEMKRRGQSITMLMPSKASFYQPYGWEVYCHQWKESLSMDDLRDMGVKGSRYAYIRDTNDYHWLAEVYEAYTKELDGYAVRSKEDWHRLLSSVFAEGGHVAVLFEEDTPVGYLFYTLGGTTITCSEFLYLSYRAKQGLLYYLYNHRSQGEAVQWNTGLHDVTYRLYGNGKQGHETMPFMAGRIVDVCKALEAVTYEGEDGSCVLEVQDPLAPWNCGRFLWTVKEGKGQVTRVEREADISLSIGSLSLLLFGAMTANELAQCNRLEGQQDRIQWLTQALPKKNTFINEWY